MLLQAGTSGSDGDGPCRASCSSIGSACSVELGSSSSSSSNASTASAKPAADSSKALVAQAVAILAALLRRADGLAVVRAQPGVLPALLRTAQQLGGQEQPDMALFKVGGVLAASLVTY